MDIHRGIADVLFHYFFHHSLGIESTILLEIKLPRILLALFIGAVLCSSGAVMQNIFHNPLVDPYLLGIASGAALGSSISIGFLNGTGLFFFAFFGSLISSFFIIFFARYVNDSTVFLVLVGVIFSAFLSAISGIIKFFVTPDQAQAIVVWLLGSISLASYKDVLFVGIISVLSLSILYLLRFRLDILGLSDIEAISLGVRPMLIRVVSMTVISLACSACVSVSGTIGWIGLLIPHFCRILFGSSISRLFMGSVFLGAQGLYIADFLAKNLTKTDLPVGSICALFGAPMFLLFLIGNKRL